MFGGPHRIALRDRSGVHSGAVFFHPPTPLAPLPVKRRSRLRALKFLGGAGGGRFWSLVVSASALLVHQRSLSGRPPTLRANPALLPAATGRALVLPGGDAPLPWARPRRPPAQRLGDEERRGAGAAISEPAAAGKPVQGFSAAAAGEQPGRQDAARRTARGKRTER